MENVYTKCNTGILQLAFSTIVIYKTVELHAQYQLQDKGMGYRKSNDTSNSVILYPSITFVERNFLKYI